MPACDGETSSPDNELASFNAALTHNPWTKDEVDSSKMLLRTDHNTALKDEPRSPQQIQAPLPASETMMPPEQHDRHWTYKKPRTSLRNREPRSCGMVWRCLLSLSLMAVIICSALSPKEMSKNTALCVAVGVASFVAAVQFYIIVTRFLRCLPYSIWAVLVLDGLSVLGWLAAIAVMAYWHRDVLYKPRGGDPTKWFSCYKDAGSHNFWDSSIGGTSSTIDIVWCSVKVDGRPQLIGNGAARLQHRTVIGLTATSLFFNGFVLYISLRKQRDPDRGRV